MVVEVVFGCGASCPSAAVRVRPVAFGRLDPLGEQAAHCVRSGPSVVILTAESGIENASGAGETHRRPAAAQSRPASCSRSVSSPIPPIFSASVWKCLMSNDFPALACASDRAASQRRSPILYAGAWPGQPR